MFLVGVFDEFNENWYLRIGTALFISQAVMVILPHFFTIFQAAGLCLVRCWDRRLSLNTKNTSCIIQSEYEDLYTGPEFILEVRYGQVLATIFVTVTFASGMPSLYALNFVIFFMHYWIDKWLLFNYYKRTPQFTHHLSKSVVDMLPYAIIIHLMFAFMTFSYPYIFRSDRVSPWFGNSTQYFNSERLG